MTMRTITVDDLQSAWRAQGVPQDHCAVKCPVCGTVQSFADVREAAAKASPEHLRAYFGEGPIDPLLHFGFSCVGRFNGQPGWKEPGWQEGKGCNWTLGGFFHAHRLEVISPDGEKHPYFEPATPEEAQAHLQAVQLQEAA